MPPKKPPAPSPPVDQRIQTLSTFKLIFDPLVKIIIGVLLIGGMFTREEGRLTAIELKIDMYERRVSELNAFLEESIKDRARIHEQLVNLTAQLQTLQGKVK